MLADELYFFNNTAMSESKIPLPLSKSERIIFYVNRAYFRFSKKHCLESIESTEGRFYLTTMRVIYIPDSTATFHSFFVPLSKIFKLSHNSYFECLCDNKYISTVNFDFKSLQKDFFVSKLRNAIETVPMNIDLEFANEENSEKIPYYSDLCDI